jgi:nitrate/nitrite transport system ATP-binding protein
MIIPLSTDSKTNSNLTQKGMNPSDKISSQTDTAFLSIDNVSKVYNAAKGPYTVLDGVNLQVAEGEFICIIGHSGCGKSTLLNMVSGFNQPTNGTVKLHDKPITEPGPDRMMVFQNYCLLPWKSAYDNVQLAVNSVYPDKSKKEKTDLAQHYLEMVGLTDAQEKKPHQLSGGMKQRVAIARALSISPEVLILDEPFGALDAITKEELQEELLKIWRETQLTVLMITHDIDEALFLADRLVMMTNGPSAKIGEILEIPFARPRDRAQITEDPRYYELRNYALDFLFHRFAHDEDDEVTEEEVSNQWGFKKIAGIVGGLAAIAFIGYGFFNTFAPKGENAPQPAVQTPAKP